MSLNQEGRRSSGLGALKPGIQSGFSSGLELGSGLELRLGSGIEVGYNRKVVEYGVTESEGPLRVWL